MLSRVADSLYWMSRYLERAENIARLIDVHMNSMLDMNIEMVEHQRVIRLQKSLISDPSQANKSTVDDIILRNLTFNRTHPVSIVSGVMNARENARQIREQISSEMWTQINKLYLLVSNAESNNVWSNSIHDFYIQVKDGSHLFQGITDATMNHNQGWHFIQIGRYIERSLSLLQLLEVHFYDNQHQEPEFASNTYFEMVTILKSVTAFEAYCKVYNPNLQSVHIVEFLLFNKEFPRSLRFCIEMMQVSLEFLAEATHRSKNTRLYRMSGRLQSNLSYDEIQDVDDLHDYLQNIKTQIYQIHDMLYDTFITYPIESAL